MRSALRNISNDPLRLGTVRRIVTDMATTAAYCEPQVYQIKDRRKVSLPDHPASLILAEPSDEMSGFDLRRAAFVRYLLDSNAFQEIRRYPNGEIGGLDLPRTDSIIAHRTYDGRLIYRNKTTGEDILPQDLLHFAGVGLDGVIGYSIFEDNVEVELAQAALEYANAYFRNGAKMGGFFSSTSTITPDERNRIQQIIDANIDTENAHTPLILGADINWNPMSAEPEKSQLHESRQASVEDLARLLGYPLKKLTGDTSPDIRAEFVECIRLHLEVFEAQYTFKLLTKEERRQGLFIEHDLKAFKRSQDQAKIDDYAKVFGFGVVTPNEVREALNLEPSEDPNADKAFVAVNNLAAVGSQEASDALEPLADVPAPDEKDEAVKSVFSEAVGRVYRRARKAITRATTIEALDKARAVETAFARESLAAYARLVNRDHDTLVDTLMEIVEGEELGVDTVVDQLWEVK